jgi:hypothetical protein
MKTIYAFLLSSIRTIHLAHRKVNILELREKRELYCSIKDQNQLFSTILNVVAPH